VSVAATLFPPVHDAHGRTVSSRPRARAALKVAKPPATWRSGSTITKGRVLCAVPGSCQRGPALEGSRPLPGRTDGAWAMPGA